jgi:lysophospholipase L1-like esterase
MSEPPKIEYEERTGGYWYADEWNATGKFNNSSSTSAKRTNIIPVTPGDTFDYKGYAETAPDSVVWLDASQRYISDEKYNSTSSFTRVTVPQGASYVWFSSFQYTTNINAVILEVKWVNCQSIEEIYVWTNTGISYAPSGGTEVVTTPDVLANKKIVYDGDSICMGYNAEGGYPSLIATVTGGSYDNQGVGGGRLTYDTTRHSVVNNLANLPIDGDLYCFQGGINDYWGNVSLGTCTQGDYTSTVDTTTICGALEEIFRYALNNFVGKPICFIITHKIQNTAYQKNTAGHTFKDYRDAMVEVCEKYSIPYYDAFSTSGLNGWNDAQNNAYLTANGSKIPDGTHPNKEGYKRYYVPQLLTLFRSILPIESNTKRD